MLRLQKSSNGEQIHLTLRENEKFFNSLFLKALAVALGFHLAGFLLFTIQPFTFTSSFLFPPIAVQTDLGSTSIAQSQLETHEIPLSKPPFTVMYPKDSSRFKKEILDTSAFLNLQTRRQSTPSTQTVEKPRIRIIVSGELAHLTFELEDAHLNELVLVPIDKDPQTIQYAVIIHEKTGEVFWYERLKTSESTYLDSIVETTLLNLKFKVDGTLDVKKGQINFIIY